MLIPIGEMTRESVPQIWSDKPLSSSAFTEVSIMAASLATLAESISLIFKSEAAGCPQAYNKALVMNNTGKIREEK